MNPDPAIPATPRAPRWPIGLGFLAGAVSWLLACIPHKNYNAIPFLLFACFGLPLVATILALILQTRRFGLGLLLAAGLGWLVLGAICGGLFRR
jgi:predicted membrane channel-forming protein YqfA (hemolysin III family)